MTHARAGQNLKRGHGWLLFFFAIAACERGNGAAMTVIQARETRLTTVADERIYQATDVLFARLRAASAASRDSRLVAAAVLVGGSEHQSVRSSKIRRTPAVRGAALTHLRF